MFQIIYKTIKLSICTHKTLLSSLCYSMEVWSVSRELEAVLCNTSDMIGVGTGSHVQYTLFPK